MLGAETKKSKIFTNSLKSNSMHYILNHVTYLIKHVALINDWFHRGGCILLLLLSMLHMLYSTLLEENPASYKFIIEERTVFIISSENHRHYFFGSYTKAVVFNFVKGLLQNRISNHYNTETFCPQLH